MVAMMLPVARRRLLSARACIFTTVAEREGMQTSMLRYKTCADIVKTQLRHHAVYKSYSSAPLSATCFAVALPFSIMKPT